MFSNTYKNSKNHYHYIMGRGDNKNSYYIRGTWSD